MMRKRGSNKGVSPVIATVLLIGLVVTLGVVVFLWFRSFTQEAVTKFGGENIELVCGDVQFDASYSGGNLAIENIGNVPIYSFNVQINSAGGIYTTEEIANMVDWPEIGLRQGGVFSGNIASQIASYNPTELVFIPILRGTISSGDEKSYTCGERFGKSVSV